MQQGLILKLYTYVSEKDLGSSTDMNSIYSSNFVSRTGLSHTTQLIIWAEEYKQNTHCWPIGHIRKKLKDMKLILKS